MIPYKPYVCGKHVDSILGICKNMTKKVFNLNNTIPHSVHLVGPLMVLKTFCSQINLHQATMTAITVMPGSVTAYTINPWNNTEASRPRKDEKNSLTDGASRPTSNTTSTPKQPN